MRIMSRVMLTPASTVVKLYQEKTSSVAKLARQNSTTLDGQLNNERNKAKRFQQI